MTDLLAERFAALVEPGQADWADVLQRARPRRCRLTVAAAAVAAALVTAAAVVAAGAWFFTKDGDTVNGQTSVQFHGAKYTVYAEVISGGRDLSLVLLKGAPSLAAIEQSLAFASGGYVLAAPGVPPEPALSNPPAPSGPPVAGNAYVREGGEIVFGDARPDVGRVELRDRKGHTFSTATAAAPLQFQDAFRVWAIALPSSTATTISAYNQHGKLMMRAPFYPTRNISLH
jgi:hypothetical protein